MVLEPSNPPSKLQKQYLMYSITLPSQYQKPPKQGFTDSSPSKHKNKYNGEVFAKPSHVYIYIYIYIYMRSAQRKPNYTVVRV